METSFKNCIFFLTTHLLVALIGYSYRQFFISLLYDVGRESFEENEVWNNSNLVFPYEDHLPTTIPEVHSPIYLIELAKLESFIFNLLTDFETDVGHDLDPEFLEKIQL